MLKRFLFAVALAASTLLVTGTVPRAAQASATNVFSSAQHLPADAYGSDGCYYCYSYRAGSSEQHIATVAPKLAASSSYPDDNGSPGKHSLAGPLHVEEQSDARSACGWAQRGDDHSKAGRLGQQRRIAVRQCAVLTRCPRLRMVHRRAARIPELTSTSLCSSTREAAPRGCASRGRRCHRDCSPMRLVVGAAVAVLLLPASGPVAVAVVAAIGSPYALAWRLLGRGADVWRGGLRGAGDGSGDEKRGRRQHDGEEQTLEHQITP